MCTEKTKKLWKERKKDLTRTCIVRDGSVERSVLRVRNFTTLHELFRVYVDPDGVLRTDHKISFVGLTILRLHYKMTPLGERSGASSEAAENFPAGHVVSRIRTLRG